MIAAKLQIRISNFVETILHNDVHAFDFVKTDNNSDTNAFLNKIIPNLLLIRKKRRELIHDSISNALQFNDDNLTERMRSYMDTIIDDIYFEDSYISQLKSSIWIRPTQHTMANFDKIIEYETYITQQDTTTCIRNMLSEYAILPQFKREKLVFRKELKLLTASYNEDRCIVVEYNDEKLKVVVPDFVTGYIYDQSNYVLCFDLDNDTIRVLLLHKIKCPYLTEICYTVYEVVYNKLHEVIKEPGFAGNEIFQIDEDKKCS